MFNTVSFLPLYLYTQSFDLSFFIGVTGPASLARGPQEASADQGQEAAANGRGRRRSRRRMRSRRRERREKESSKQGKCDVTFSTPTKGTT